MGIEKRKQDRVSVSLAAILDFSSGSREARISDISLSGCFIDSIANVVENETLSFKLDFSGGQSAKFYGQVAYVYPGVGFGLHFIRLTKTEEALLRQIIIEHGGKIPEPVDSQVEEETAEQEISEQKHERQDKKTSFDDIMRSIQESLENDES